MGNLVQKVIVFLASTFSINASLFSSEYDSPPSLNIILFILTSISVPSLNILAIIVGMIVDVSQWFSPIGFMFLVFCFVSNAVLFIFALSQCKKDDNKVVLMAPCLVANYLASFLPYTLEFTSTSHVSEDMNIALFVLFLSLLISVPVFIIYPMNRFVYDETRKRLKGETSLLDEQSYFVIDGKRIGLFKSAVLLISRGIRGAFELFRK